MAESLAANLLESDKWSQVVLLVNGLVVLSKVLFALRPILLSMKVPLVLEDETF